MAVRGLLLLVLTCALWYFANANGSGCSASNNEYLKNQRLDNVLAHIRAQLDPSMLMQESETDNATSHEVDETVLEMFHALQNTSSSDQTGWSSNQGRKDSCQANSAFYAKPVTTFLGTMTPVQTPEDVLTSNSNQSCSFPVEQGFHILSAYRVDLQFNLDQQLRDLSRASLLLYQEPTLTGPTIQPRDYQQYVQVTTVIDQVRFPMEGKNLDTFGNDYQTFDITKAVNLWLQYGVQGNITLDVVIYCSSSPNCAKVDSRGRSPAKIKFLYSTLDSSKAPRVIVVSNSPLEKGEAVITKRSAGNSPQFCSAPDDDLCCLKPLTINFKEDLRLPSVIRPESFEANYCEGDCLALSGTAQLTPQRYTFLRHLGYDHPALSVEPCCAGADYRDLDVIMNSYNRDTKRLESQIVKLHQVKVVGCRCA